MGGNCELTRPGEAVVDSGVTILGPLDVPSMVPLHASQLYGRNVTSLLQHLASDGRAALDLQDEIAQAMLVVHDGKVRP
jgi:NAD(P) transhydrogenase subunit alpha